MKRLALSMACVAALLSACGSAPVREAPPRPPVDPASVPDAVPRAEPRSARGNPPFYEVFGHDAVALLDGGMGAWESLESAELETSPPLYPASASADACARQSATTGAESTSWRQRSRRSTSGAGLCWSLWPA